MNAITFYSELFNWLLDHVTDSDMFVLQSAVTCGALFWLLHRAWLTLWKPVPDLINILGVEVPDAPEVSLGEIKADAVTLHWTRPGAHRPVVRYDIQVNGVTVGELSRHETAITVTGLKSGHFYNVRVVAVGSNTFQAGSRVIRLRTYASVGQSNLGSSRVQGNGSVESLQNGTLVDSSDDTIGSRSLGASVEAAAVRDAAPAMVREHSGSYTGQRRNTLGGRRHSPSVATEQVSAALILQSRNVEGTMQELTERFETIRNETEETLAQAIKDSDDFKAQMAGLLRERDDKRQMLKEKEEASEKLKKEVNQSERLNRQAQTRKTQKEKILKDKQAEKSKMKDDAARWRKEVADMQSERKFWQKESDKMAKITEKKLDELREELQARQNALTSMEEEIRVKGLQIKELEEERRRLPGGQDDEESRERDTTERQHDAQWDIKERDLMSRINNQLIRLRVADVDIQRAQSVYIGLTSQQASNSMMYHANSSGVDFDHTGQSQAKARKSRQRKSRTNTISSSVARYPPDHGFSSPNPFGNPTATSSPGFAPGSYFDMSNNTGFNHISDTGLNEGDLKFLTAGAPLSPTATALLPSNIFADDEPPMTQLVPGRLFRPDSFPNTSLPNQENEMQLSPSSSSRSASLVSSPKASSNNLHDSSIQHSDIDGENRSMYPPTANFGAIGSPKTSVDAQLAPPKRFGDLFSFQRPRGKSTEDDQGPALGSLKSNQSQSFPRHTDEVETLANRQRRISFSSGWGVPSFLGRSATSGDVPEGNGPALARNTARRRRGFNMFGSSIDDPSAAYSERDPGSPRPASIASSDLPRPSTDSAPFGWPAAEGGVAKNSPLATNWSLNVAHPWSRNPSRRPSVQHGSSTGISSGIATEYDDFLPADTLSQQTSPPPVGVIGSRPLSSHKPVTPKLNPAAPTFKAMFGLNSKAASLSDKGKEMELSSDSIDELIARPVTIDDNSPPASRKSRDAYSIRTQDSIADSHDSLDQTLSNTPSEMTTPSTASARDGKENSFQKLLRKGSSSKFSFSSIRGKESSLFNANKRANAPGADRAAGGDRSSNFGDTDDGAAEGGDGSLLGRSLDNLSVTNSPQLGPSAKEGRMGWGRFSIKKGKGKRDSLDVADRGEASRSSEPEMTEDEETSNA